MASALAVAHGTWDLFTAEPVDDHSAVFTFVNLRNAIEFMAACDGRVRSCFLENNDLPKAFNKDYCYLKVSSRSMIEFVVKMSGFIMVSLLPLSFSADVISRIY
jgi:hypothetical protein